MGFLGSLAANSSPVRGLRQKGLMSLLAVLSVPLAAVVYCPSLAGVMALQFFAMSIAAGFIIVSISYATHVYSVSSSGLIAGLGAGAWSAAVAVTSPFFGYLFDETRFALAFLVASLLPAGGLLLWAVLARRGPRGG